METDSFYLELALEEAEHAGREGTYPIGALIVGPDGTILSRGHNRVYSIGDYTAHAEVEVLRNAREVLMNPSYRGKCTLYTTLEPCFMCTGALLMARIARVVWAANDSDYGALQTLYQGGSYPTLFASLQMTATPELTIANRANELMQQWVNDPKPQMTRWTGIETAK